MTLRNRIAASVLGLALSGVASACLAASYDMIIRNGTVFDGSGQPGQAVDVGIRDGRIVAVGHLAGATAKQEIDAAGLYVAPGFINVHDHSVPRSAGTGVNYLIQGVTTAFANADGGGATNITDELNFYAAKGLAFNLGAQIGFNSVWASVVGPTDRRATPDEMSRMQTLIQDNLRRGAWGVSAGLDYKPGYYATTEEVIDVVKVAGPWRTFFPNHERLRPEENWSSLKGIAETIEIASKAGLSPEITHIKVQGHEQGHSLDVLRMMDAATHAGHYTPADVYPYLAGATGLGALLVPGWALDGGREAMLKRFKDPALRPKIIAEIERTMQARFNGPSGVYMPTTQEELTHTMSERHVSAGEALIEKLEETDQPAILRFGAEEDVMHFLKAPDIAIACDCGASDAKRPHPRYWGTWPKVLGHYVREEHVLTWENAIRKMSGLPATISGLVDRGFIQPGMWADVAIFNPKTIIDHSTYPEPTVPPDGMEYVVVNGKLALSHGKPTGQQGGVLLYRTSHMPTRPMEPMSTARSISGHDIVVASSDAHIGQVKLTFRLSQAADARTASGSLTATGAGGRQIFKMTSFGTLQTGPQWASITGLAQFAGGHTSSVTLIFDGANPVEQSEKASVTISSDAFALAGWTEKSAIAF